MRKPVSRQAFGDQKLDNLSLRFGRLGENAFERGMRRDQLFKDAQAFRGELRARGAAVNDARADDFPCPKAHQVMLKIVASVP